MFSRCFIFFQRNGFYLNLLGYVKYILFYVVSDLRVRFFFIVKPPVGIVTHVSGSKAKIYTV